VGTHRPKRRQTERLSRSDIMRRVPRERTTPERAVARFLAYHGIRFRYNVRGLPGTPDLANKRRRFAIFVHGCFWHRHAGCRKTTTPKTHRVFWLAKFAANQRRDTARREALKIMGYRVVIIWECQTTTPAALRKSLRALLN
jgi:DNA mismatch endonuclease, patch repair protein